MKKVVVREDYPVVNTREELERFFRIPLTDDEREAILWNNAMRFFHMEDA